MDDAISTVMDEAVAVLEECMAAIRAEMEAQDVNASGRTSRSLRVERYDGGVRLVIGGTAERTAPLATLEVGRPPGDVPGGFRTTREGVTDVSNTFKAILVQWARDKGIQGFGWGAATMLGRRIAAEGTLRHSSPKVIYSQAVRDAEAKLKDRVRVTVTKAIHDEILKTTP